MKSTDNTIKFFLVVVIAPIESIPTKYLEPL
jgi:hypothetical protein